MSGLLNPTLVSLPLLPLTSPNSHYFLIYPYSLLITPTSLITPLIISPDSTPLKISTTDERPTETIIFLKIVLTTENYLKIILAQMNSLG